MSIMITDCYVATVNDSDELLRGAAIYVEDGEIKDLGPSAELKKIHRADILIDGRKRIVIPGLVNSHTHLTDTLVRSLGADMPLLEWLDRFIWPFFEALEGEEVSIAASLGLLESLRSGTTTVIENYYAPREKRRNFDYLARACISSGLRVIAARGYHDRRFGIPEAFIEDLDGLKEEYGRIFSQWDGKGEGRLRIWVSPVDLLFCSPENIRVLHSFAKEHGSGIHTHVAESMSEVQLVKDHLGKRYVEVFDDLGVLDRFFHCAHSVWLNEHEIDLLARSGGCVAHCPGSNMYLGVGVAPIPLMLKRGVVVGLGTDGACCNNNLDMIETMKQTALLHKVKAQDPSAITAREVLRMATHNGARLIGMEREIGSIEVGKKADLVVINLNKAHTVPLLDPVADLVYSGRCSDVETVIIGGKILLQNGIATTVDENLLRDRAQQAAEDIVERTPSLSKLQSK